MDDVATKHQRAPERVSLCSFYYELWVVAAEKSNCQDFVENGRECPFTREEIEHALRGQGISNEDIQAAIDHCVGTRKILVEKEGIFHATESGLADYLFLLRSL